MSTVQARKPLYLPVGLQRQLHAFRRRVWTIKMAEAIGAALFVLIVAYLCVFGMDRLGDTLRGLRFAFWVLALCGCAFVPWQVHRWIWRQRRLEQLSRLLTMKLPRLGDQLLGIIELVDSEGEQKRSRALCEAAVRSVARDAQKVNFDTAAPDSRHRSWWMAAAIFGMATIGLAVAFPRAASNAWARFLAPWSNTPRYTFTELDRLPAEIVVPHGEPFQMTVHLAAGSPWRPREGWSQLGAQAPVIAPLQDGHYRFEMSAQIAEGTLQLRIGDARQTVRIKPMLRPELTSMVAEVTLPAYLGQPKPIMKDVRGGSIALVKGSRVRFIATANRPLSSAMVDDDPYLPYGAEIRTAPKYVDYLNRLQFAWRDTFGLTGKEPFLLNVTACDDEAPSLACEDLPRARVVLDSEQLNFRVKAEDDFGVKQVGLMWQGIDATAVSKPAQGEHVIAAGGYEKRQVEATGTFSAQSLGIEPQPINLRVFVEDYFPGRKRVCSANYVLYVLTAEQHAIWITEQLNKWHRQALEVRDREMQLHETNKQLRNLPADELDKPDVRRRIENQSAAERANGRRLTSLTVAGTELLRQASRNPQFDVGALNRWAEMMQILKDIAAARMPSVADLLREAAKAEASGAKPSPSGPKAGQSRGGGGKPSEPPPADKSVPKPPAPKVVDGESSLQPPGKGDGSKAPPKKPSAAALQLPTTTLIGQSGDTPKPPPSPAGAKVNEAVRRQQDLLAEFEKIVNELNNILANLEGSTLVKRLKAASREQYRVAGRVGDLVNVSFGKEEFQVPSEGRTVFRELAKKENASSQNLSTIMDDMQAYFERRRMMKFKTVLEDMKKQDVVGGLRQIADDLHSEPGLSIAQCEFWWDTMDRWAEDLVDPAGDCMCQGTCSPDSLPPAIVLEVLKILEGEVNLREETRVAEQARPALKRDEYGTRAGKLSKTQGSLHTRVKDVTEQIRALPDSAKQFGREIKILGAVAEVMDDARQILARPETGSLAIGAETEAIELLLQSRRINPRGGGGGGPAPGGGGGGSTSDSALALLGIGVNNKEVRDAGTAVQATGTSGRSLPEEFRAGLDQYFNRLENRD